MEKIDKMLKEIGISDISELFSDVPKKDCVLDLPPKKDEMTLSFEVKEIVSLNKTLLKSFAGGGCYFHWVPAVVDWVSSLSGFLTSYTPYQPEISQGVLQALFEFQSLICRLFESDVSNAGMYGGASSLAEAVLMAVRIHQKGKVALSLGINPLWLATVKTYAETNGISIEFLELDENGHTKIKSDDFDAVCVQYPNFFGVIEPVFEMRKEVKGIFITATPDPTDLAILNPPDADIKVAEGQSLGNYPYFGGSSFGIFCTSSKFIRRIPGRLVGETTDAEGNWCFSLTLQTREQHIRREKATSNICTSTSNNAIRSAVYLSLLGYKGLRKVAAQGYKNAHVLSDKLKSKVKRSKSLFSGKFFKEFAMILDIDEDKIVGEGFIPPLRLAKIKNFLPEFPYLDDDTFLLCTTEMLNEKDIEKLISLISS